MQGQSITRWLKEALAGDETMILGTAVTPVHTARVLTAARRVGVTVTTKRCYVSMPDARMPVTLNALYIRLVKVRSYD